MIKGIFILSQTKVLNINFATTSLFFLISAFILFFIIRIFDEIYIGTDQKSDLIYIIISVIVSILFTCSCNSLFYRPLDEYKVTIDKDIVDYNELYTHFDIISTENEILTIREKR